MPARQSTPKYERDPEGPQWAFQVHVERWRFITYCSFWFFVLFSMGMTKWVDAPVLLAGAPEGTPIERLGCGPFNRDKNALEGSSKTKFGLVYGQGFDVYEQSHLADAFGFANICTNWDYGESREVTSMIFPLFEFSMMIYLLLNYTNSYLSFKRGELPKWFWNFTRIIVPVEIFTCAMFRLIFVAIAYENTSFHTFGFLCLQVGIMLIAIDNTLFVVLTGKEYPGLSKQRVEQIAWFYLLANIFVSYFKVEGTIYIVRHSVGSDFYQKPSPFGDFVWGKVVDIFWMLLNAVAPFVIAYVRMINEPPLEFKITLPTPTYVDYSPQTGETTPLTA